MFRCCCFPLLLFFFRFSFFSAVFIYLLLLSLLFLLLFEGCKGDQSVEGGGWGWGHKSVFRCSGTNCHKVNSTNLQNSSSLSSSSYSSSLSSASARPFKPFHHQTSPSEKQHHVKEELIVKSETSLPSGCARQYRQFCGLNEDGCYWPCGLRFSGGKRVSSTFPKSRPMLTARHRPKLPDTIRNFPTPSEISRHCPKLPDIFRNFPTLSEITRHRPKLPDTGRHRPKLSDISHVRSPRPLASQSVHAEWSAVAVSGSWPAWYEVSHCLCGTSRFSTACAIRGFPLPV